MIDFLRYRYYSYAFFAFVVASCIGLYVYRGGFNFSVDFTGGTMVLLRFSKPVTHDQIAELLRKTAWKGPEVSAFNEYSMRIRMKEVSTNPTGIGDQVREYLEKELPGNKITIDQAEGVSDSIGDTLVWSSIKAILISLLLMLLYIGLRFQFAFSTGAVVALIHDAFVMALFFLLFNLEVSMNVIGAVLAILGYSNNDTIVIFARIRSRLKTAIGEPLDKIINEAITSTLRRTLLTSFATSLVVTSLLIFGGGVLRNLSIALLVGIVFGTYSSIFIASPVMRMLYKEKKSA